MIVLGFNLIEFISVNPQDSYASFHSSRVCQSMCRYDWHVAVTPGSS